jgi:methionyl-tRNA formyltransferase
VKKLALDRGLIVFQPESVSRPESVALLKNLSPDALIVAAYGQILRQSVLDLPRRGILNVHASLLPRWRGASPIAAAILAGDAVTGVTIMEIVRALDAGPMVAKVEEQILDSDTTGSLEPRLAGAGAQLLVSVLDGWANGAITPVAQDDSLATYAPQLKREDARLDWSLPAIDLWRRIRAFNPWPVAFTRWQEEELRIWEAAHHPLSGRAEATPGAVVPDARGGGPRDRGLFVQTGDGLLEIVSLQRPGRKAMSGAEFLRGQPRIAGSVLG